MGESTFPRFERLRFESGALLCVTLVQRWRVFHMVLFEDPGGAQRSTEGTRTEHHVTDSPLSTHWGIDRVVEGSGALGFEGLPSDKGSIDGVDIFILGEDHHHEIIAVGLVDIGDLDIVDGHVLLYLVLTETWTLLTDWQIELEESWR